MIDSLSPSQLEGDDLQYFNELLEVMTNDKYRMEPDAAVKEALRLVKESLKRLEAKHV
jgi:hypothetical protein